MRNANVFSYSWTRQTTRDYAGNSEREFEYPLVLPPVHTVVQLPEN